MITIVYASRAAAPMNGAALEQLLAEARARNEREQVTGMLIYAYGSFLQQLEGDGDAVERVYASIARDRRHTEIRLLSRRPVESRTYAGWSMGFECLDAATLADRLDGYRANAEHPLVSAELVPNTEIAEAMLVLAAGARTG